MQKEFAKFRIHEAVLLLDLYLRGTAEGFSLTHIASDVSQILRTMAVNQGICIDDGFRSVKGVLGRVISMKAAYTGQSDSGRIPSLLFRDVVRIFRDEPEHYAVLLNEALRMAGNQEEMKLVFHCEADKSVHETATFSPDISGILSTIRTNYPNGLRMDETTLRLLETVSQYPINAATRKALQKALFRRRDGVYFMKETIADSSQLVYMENAVRQYLDSFSCFEPSVVFEQTFREGVPKELRAETDQEDFLRFLYPNSLCIGSSCQTRIARRTDLSMEVCVSGLVNRLMNAVDECGCIPADELEERFPAFSSEYIRKLLSRATNECIPAVLNGIPCYQSIQSLGLDETFSAILEKVLEEIETLELETTADTLHVLISAHLHTNFMSEYNIPNKKAFQKVITLYYRGKLHRIWKGGRFVEETKCITMNGTPQQADTS